MSVVLINPYVFGGVSYTLGQAAEGGYFAGFISHSADSVATHALIVGPRATAAIGFGYPIGNSLAWKTTETSTANTDSLFDGVANTAAIVTAGIASHPAANFCKNLTVGGFSDWYLPAIYELEIAYFNLKPSTQSNLTNFGTNPYSVPRRDSNYTASVPPQTTITAFNTTAESFVAAIHLSSTQSGAPYVRGLGFDVGDINTGISKKSLNLLRAFRRIPL